MGVSSQKLPSQQIVLPLRPAALAAGVVLLGYVLMSLLFRDREWFTQFNDLTLMVLNLLAAAALFYAARQSRRLGRRMALAWSLLALAQLLYALADGLWLYLQAVMGEPPYPSITDLLYLSYYPLFALGLFLIPAAKLSREERLKNILDVSTVVVAALLLSWQFIIGPTLADSDGDILLLAVSMAYPVLDLVLFFTLLMLLFRKGLQVTLEPLYLLELSVLGTIVADVLFIYQTFSDGYAPGNLVDIAYIASYSFVILAGLLHGSRARRAEPPEAHEYRPGWVVYLPYVWSVPAYLMLFLADQVIIPYLVLVFGVGLVLALIASRQMLALNENAQLYKEERARRRLAESMGSTGVALTSNLDYNSVPGLILDQLATVVPYERCSIMLHEHSTLYIVAQRGFPVDQDQRTKSLRINLREDDVFLKMCASRQPTVIDDVTQAVGWFIAPWLPLNKSWLGAPLIVRDQVIGMISMTRPAAGAFSLSETVLTTAFAGQAAVALENARLYGELNQAYQNLEILDRTKGKFIEVVAHELRTPLTVIKGYTQVLGSLPELNGHPQAGSILEGLDHGMQRMQEMINDMLDVTKITTQSIKLYKQPTSLGELLEDILVRFEEVFIERNLHFEQQGFKDLPLISLDSDLMGKALLHLVMNAIKYTPDGGSIKVSARVEYTENYVEIVVSDTGIGIDPANHDLIFEKFYTTGEVALHSSSRTNFKGGGPGLGLALVRGIILAHGGEIWVESIGYNEQTCPGSSFYVRLPILSGPQGS